MPPELVASRRLDWLRRQYDQALADVQTVTDRAADEDRDLTDAENSMCEARRSRLAELDDDIKAEADLAERSANYNALVGHIGPATSHSVERVVERQEPETIYETPGQYLTDFLLRSESDEARQRFDRYWKTRAVQNQTTAQTPGLLPTPILGPVFIAQSSRRPALEAATQRPLPGAGKTFQRPMISQHTLAGPQTAEKTEVPSRTLNVDPITITKTTYGGVVNLSWQDRDWTEPAIMDLLVSDLAASYANATDEAFCTYFVGSVTETEAVATPDGAGILAALFAASGTIYDQTNGMPDTLWVSPDVWGMLGSMVDSTGRQLFPTIGPSNALGSIQPTSMTGSVAGFRMVIDRHLPAATAILGDSLYVEVYETVGGQVSAIEPSILGTQIAWYGYIAWQTLVPDAFVKLTGVTPPAVQTAGNGGTTGGAAASYSAASS